MTVADNVQRRAPHALEVAGLSMTTLASANAVHVRSFARSNGMSRHPAQHLICLSALPGILQNDPATMIIDKRPLLDLLESSKAAETDVIIAQAAIPYARGLSAVVGITHWRRHEWLGVRN
jgi:hypothetical protein